MNTPQNEPIRRAVSPDATSIYASFPHKDADLGLKAFHHENDDFAVAVKLIHLLAFIPVAEIDKVFEHLVEKICDLLDKLKADTCILEKTDQLTSYFQNGKEREGRHLSHRTLESESRNVRGLDPLNQRCVGMALQCVSTMFQGSHPPITFSFGC